MALTERSYPARPENILLQHGTGMEVQGARWQELLCVLTEEGNKEDLSPSCCSWDGTSNAGSAGIFPTLPPSMFCCGAGESHPQLGESPRSSTPSAVVASPMPLTPWAEFGPF